MKRLILFFAVAALAGAHAVRAQDAPDAINLRRTIVVEIVARTKDAVVNISAEKIVTARVNPFGGNPFWEGFAGPMVRRRATSLGSGFIIHQDGYVVTNNHVIDRATRITVELADGRKLPAEVVSADTEADLAILKISDPKPLPVLELGTSSDLMIGEPVIAVGNPFGYSHTVSTGIVSAVHRDLGEEQASLKDLIQTDAAINPGNSGGPLLNAYGQVIGINSAVRTDAQNIGFSIQVDRLRDLIPVLMNPAQAAKVDVQVHLRERRILTPPATVKSQIISADPAPADGDAPATEAITSGRVVRTINGHTPHNIIDAYALLLRVKAGQHLVIGWADGERQTFLASAVQLPDAVAQGKRRLGLTVEQVTPALAQQDNLATEKGILVDAVEPGSIAQRAGIHPGDVIVQLGRFKVATLDDFSALIPYFPTDSGRVYIGVIRQNQLKIGWLIFGEQAQAQ
jgi:serine protease Do